MTALLCTWPTKSSMDFLQCLLRPLRNLACGFGSLGVWVLNASCHKHDAPSDPNSPFVTDFKMHGASCLHITFSQIILLRLHLHIFSFREMTRGKNHMKPFRAEALKRNMMADILQTICDFSWVKIILLGFEFLCSILPKGLIVR